MKKGSYAVTFTLFATLTLSAITGRAQQDPDEFELIARTGAASGLTRIGRGPSINDLGYVAFTARRGQADGAEYENVYSFHPGTKQLQPLMNHIFEYLASNTNSPTQIFDEHVQVNNQNRVLAWRNLNARVQLISWIIIPTMRSVEVSIPNRPVSGPGRRKRNKSFAAPSLTTIRWLESTIGAAGTTR